MQTEDYDCLLLDINMRGMRSDELYTLIENLDQNLAQNVIFTTAGAIDPTSHALLLATGNPIFQKPFVLVELQRQMLSVLKLPNNQHLDPP